MLSHRIASLEAEGARAAIVTVVKVTGSTPRSPGAKMIVFEDGRTEGTIGGGAIEHEVIREAREAIGLAEPRFVEHKLTQELGMCCGGQVSLFIEPIARAPELVIFGAGHVGCALCRAATAAGFVVTVVDEREERLSDPLLERAARRTSDLDDPAISYGPKTFVMVTTHDHALDQRLVEKLIVKPLGWLGLIGSQRKARVTRERLAHKELPNIERLRTPVGLSIGAETPEEIAVAILAELIAVRRGVDVSHALEKKSRRENEVKSK